MLIHYQHCTDLGHFFVTDFHYWLIRESLIFARFSAARMGVGLYVSLHSMKFSLTGVKKIFREDLLLLLVFNTRELREIAEHFISHDHHSAAIMPVAK